MSLPRLPHENEIIKIKQDPEERIVLNFLY